MHSVAQIIDDAPIGFLLNAVQRNEPPLGLYSGDLPPHHRIQVSPVRDEIVNKLKYQKKTL